MAREISTHIETLSNELLLQILESDLSPSNLASCMLTCKRWRGLTASVLYRHVVLTNQTLARWTANSSRPSKSAIESLTIRLERVQPSFEGISPAMSQLRTDMQALSAKLADMTGLKCLSLRTPQSLSTGMWVPEPLLAVLLSQLPASCSSVEIEVSSTQDLRSAEPESCHLCPYIRRLLPQLQYLRLGLPTLCPEAFGKSLGQQTVLPFEPVEAPQLEQCIVKMAVRTVPSNVSRTKHCSGRKDDDENMIIVLADCLRTFASSGNCPNLKLLRILDALPIAGYFTSFQSFVRRDVLANKSFALPFKGIGTRKDSQLIRTFTGRQDIRKTTATTDILSTKEGVQQIAEGHVWAEATSGARLPTRALRESTSLIPAEHVMRTPDEWLRETKNSCMLWVYEKRLGTKIIHVEEGGLTENCIPQMRLPDGWVVNDETGALEETSGQ